MRTLQALILTAIAAFVMLTAAKAVGAAFATDDFPEDLGIKVVLMPVIFPVHMVTGGLALLLVPLAYTLRRHARWHRLAGRIAATDIVIAGISAMPVALVAPVTAWSAAGFTAQACTWLVLLTAGIWNIRHRRIARHRAYMLLMAATTSGAVFFRIWLALWAIVTPGRHFEPAYAADAWLAWLIPLAICAALLKRAGTWRDNPG